MRLMRMAAITAGLVLASSVLQPSALLVQSASATEADELPIKPPWLRDNMPADALIYFRVPHLLGALATPKGNVMDAALRSEANIEILRKIKTGLADNVLGQLPILADLRPRLLAQHLRSPVEVAVSIAPSPSAVIALNLDLVSNNAFRNIVEVFSAVDPNIALVEPLDDQGLGQISGLGMPLFLKFDAASGLLLLNAGPGASKESFQLQINEMSSASRHRMHALEESIDENGQGLFFWIDAEQAMPAMQAILPAEQMEDLQALGLSVMRSAAFGWGVSKGKGRLAVAVDMPSEIGRGFLPYVRNDLSAKSVGNPDGLMVLSMPTAEEFSRIETLALASGTEEKRSEWAEFKALVRESTGVTIEEMLDVIGPEIIGIFDQAGDYVAIRVRDAELWNDVITRLSSITGDLPDKKRIAGKTFYHWSLPGDFGWMGEDTAAEIGWFATLMQSQREHFYWTIDGDFMYMASVPQILIDRTALGANTDIGDWLLQTQRINGAESIVLLTGTTRKLPKRVYALYIELLQYLADIAKTDIDVWSLPTALDLNLPDEGALGFTIQLGDPYMSMEFMFENNPFEALTGGGLVGVAVVGILAAIAVPAYQDYTIRAKVSEGINLAADVKTDVALHYQSSGQFPDASVAEDFSIQESAGQYTRSVMVQADSGTVVVTFNDDVLPDGGTLYFEPGVDSDDSIHWVCSATIDDKHLPTACRGNAPPIDTDDGA